MMLVRPVTVKDHAELLALAREAGIGMTSLPPDAQVLEHKIAQSVSSFTGGADTQGDEGFLFVLEDTESKKLVGSTGIVAHVGIKRPFYSYKLSTLVQTSERLNIYSLQRVLHRVNDYTGATEIGSLFLLPAYRRDGIGRFLSRSRYLMLAEFPGIFSEIVISEIRGVQDAQGDSPFYKNLAQHFFQMDFQHADFITATQGTQFISDLLPKYPIYVSLLHPSAQQVIGLPLQASLPAMQFLEREGFRWQGYIDVFDAGPTMQGEREQIRTVVESRHAPVTKIAPIAGPANILVSNLTMQDFRVAFTAAEQNDTGITLPEETVKQLGIAAGDTVRFVAR